MAISSAEDWYNITKENIRELGGSALMEIYKGSVRR
jgi:hypothetical protein